MFLRCANYITLIILSVSNAGSNVSQICLQDCLCSSQNKITCKGAIPMELPDITTEVIVTITNGIEILTKGTFTGRNWDRVTALHLKSACGLYAGILLIEADAFSGASSLLELSVTNFDDFRTATIHPTCFRGLTNLISLNLEGNLYLQVDSVFNAINFSLPNLEMINLKDVGSMDMNPFRLDRKFLQIMKQIKVRVLNLSGMKMISVDEVEGWDEAFPYLERLYMGHTNLALFTSLIYHGFRLPKTLQSLDISGMQIPTPKFNIRNKTFNVPLQFCAHVKELYVNEILSDVTIHKGTFILLPASEGYNLQKIDLMRNGIKWLDFFVEDSHLPEKLSTVEELNLSHNQIQYISPALVKYSTNLRVINVSQNQLYYMENMDEFHGVLNQNLALEVIVLARNGLSALPYDFFESNLKLTYIDLSGNKLSKLSFQINHLVELKFLDLRDNKLKMLDVSVLNRINSQRFERHHNSSNITALVVDVTGNPFVCSCDSMEFPETIIKYNSLFNRNQNGSIQCLFKDQFLPISRESLIKMDHACWLRTIITVMSIIAAGLVVICVTVALWCRRMINKRRIKRHLLDLIAQYKNPGADYEFLVFLSYSSEDSDFIFKEVYPEMETRLQKLLETDKELVCNGDMHFLAGRRIEDEIVKAIDSSKVVILLISRAFCASPWCDYETMVSYYEKKPIILMCKEEVPKEDMPSVLRKLFNKYIRAVWKDVNGHLTLYPGFDKLCDSIIEKTY